MLLNVTIPVFNEELQLAATVAKVDDFAHERLGANYEIVIADNGSTDSTLAVAKQLAKQRPGSVHIVHLEEKGRGRALKQVWLQSKADILSYMDVDLSSDLKAFPELVGAVANGQYDLAVGSRLLRPEWTTRSWEREWISRCYNWLVRRVFGTKFSDAQCGFKALARSAAQTLLPLVEDTGWFFDTELLVLAEDLGYRIFDLPVHWVEDSDSRVRILRTAMEDLNGIVRLKRRLRRARAQPLTRPK